MGWWWQRDPERGADREAALVRTMAEALGAALGRVYEAQAHQIEQSARFLDSLQDLSARKAAQIMGSRGGRSTQKRKAAARKAAGCALCVNPAHRPVTVEMVEAHRSHTLELPASEPNGNG